MIRGSHPPLPRAEQTADCSQKGVSVASDRLERLQQCLRSWPWDLCLHGFLHGCLAAGLSAPVVGCVVTVRVGPKELAVLGVLMPALHFGALTGFIKTLGNSAFSRPPEACSQTGPWNVLQL